MPLGLNDVAHGGCSTGSVPREAPRRSRNTGSPSPGAQDATVFASIVAARSGPAPEHLHVPAVSQSDRVVREPMDGRRLGGGRPEPGGFRLSGVLGPAR